MSISFSNLFSSDGSSLSGWTINGGITISSGVGNPAPSFSTGFPNYAYINPAGLSSLVGYTILADMYTTPSNWIQLYFGCNINGLGQMFRLDARPLGSGEGNGFATTTNWTNWGTPPSNNYTLTANTWYTIKIVINSTATNGMSWYYNNILGGTGTLSVNGGYIGFNASGYLDNIAVYQNNVIPASITYSMATSAQFYINVKGETVVPTKDDTGGSTLTNAGTGVTLATDATRGKVLAFSGTAYLDTNYLLPLIHTRLFWVKFSAFGNNTISSLTRPLFISTFMRFSFNYPTSYTDDTSNPITLGVWYLYALTYDGTTAILYRNGNVNLSLVPTTVSIVDKIQIGAFDSNYFLNGYLDNIRCYNTALTQQQIQNIYNYELANPTSFYYENGYTIPPSIGFTIIYSVTSGYTDYYKFDIADLNGPQAENVSLYNYGTNSYRGNLNSYPNANISSTTYYRGTGSLRLPNTTTYGAYTFSLASPINTSAYSFCLWINFVSNFTGGGNFDVLFALKDTATVAQFWPSNANEIAYLSGGTRSLGVSAINNAGTTLYGGNFSYSFSTNYGTWYHVGFTYSGGTHIMYVNGVAVSTITGWNNNNFTATYATIGGVYTLPAYIDEFILYNKTLSATEMYKNYDYYLH